MDRLDKVSEDVNEIRMELIRYNVLLARCVDELEKHMRRTEANEERIIIVEKFVEQHATVRKFVATVGAALVGGAGFLYSLLKIFEFFTKS